MGNLYVCMHVSLSTKRCQFYSLIADSAFGGDHVCIRFGTPPRRSDAVSGNYPTQNATQNARRPTAVTDCSLFVDGSSEFVRCRDDCSKHPYSR
jgi:hypothetical protein